MVSASGLGLKYMWKHNALATLDQDPPVQNTWYTILDTTEDVRLVQIQTKQTNDETVAKNLQVRITMDGETYTSGNESQNNNTTYYWYVEVDGTITVTDISSSRLTAAGPGYSTIHGQSVKVEVRITSVIGTNQTLDGRVFYETWEET